jgi:hypothetical protein
MSLPLPTASRCLDALLRYELATIQCYQFAESVLPDDRYTLSAIRRSHEFAAAALGQHITRLGRLPSTEPGLWGALGTLVEASTAFSARWAVLTMLLWSERHGIETYVSACRIPGLPVASCLLMESTLLPSLHGHVRSLEQVIALRDGHTPRADAAMTGCLA